MTWFIVWTYLIPVANVSGVLQTPPQFTDEATCQQFVEEHTTRMEDFFRGRHNASFAVEIRTAGRCKHVGQPA